MCFVSCSQCSALASLYCLQQAEGASSTQTSRNGCVSAFLQVAAAAAARPGPAGRALSADSNEENKQGSSESFLLPMPAIHIPEFGKEVTFKDMPKFPDMADKFPKVPEMPSITPPTIDWDKIKPSSDNHPSVSVTDINNQEVNTQSSQDATTDNNYKSDKPDRTGKPGKFGAGNDTPATQQQDSQQPTAAPCKLA